VGASVEHCTMAFSWVDDGVISLAGGENTFGAVPRERRAGTNLVLIG